VAGNRKGILLRLDPAVHDALARWAGDELRSTNAQIEFLLRAALTKAGRMPRNAATMPRRGRPPRAETDPETDHVPDGDTVDDDTVDHDTVDDDSADHDTVDDDSADHDTVDGADADTGA
jgi:hypothetical protein